MYDSIHDPSSLYFFLILFIFLLHFGIGQIFIKSGVFETAFFGLVIASAPTAIIANYYAKYAKYSILTTTVITLLLTSKLILNKTKQKKLEILKITLLALVIFLINHNLNGYLFFSEGKKNILYNPHHAYFTSLVSEIISANYSSRLKVFTGYPNEWGNFHFMNSSLLANLQYYLPYNNLFSYYLTLTSVISLVIATIVEKCRLQFATPFYKTILGICILFTYFAPSVKWNLLTNGTITLLAMALLFFSWPSRKNMFCWFFALGMSVSRLAPYFLFALGCLFIERYIVLNKSMQLKLYLNNLKNDLKKFYKYILLIIIFFFYNFSTIYPKYIYVEFISENRFFDSFLSPTYFYQLLSPLSIFKNHYNSVHLEFYKNQMHFMPFYKVFTTIQFVISLLFLLLTPFYAYKKDKMVFLFWIIIFCSLFFGHNAKYLVPMSLFYFSLTYALCCHEKKFCYMLLMMVFICHLLLMTGTNAIKGPIALVMFDVLLGLIFLKKFLSANTKLTKYSYTAFALFGLLAFPFELPHLRLPEDFKVDLDRMEYVRNDIKKMNLTELNPQKMLEAYPDFKNDVEILAAFSVIYQIPLLHNQKLPTLSTRHIRTQ